MEHTFLLKTYDLVRWLTVPEVDDTLTWAELDAIILYEMLKSCKEKELVPSTCDSLLEVLEGVFTVARTQHANLLWKNFAYLLVWSRRM